MLIQAIALNHKTKKLNNPQYVKNRINRNTADSFYFWLAKNFFHFVSIFSTTMMLSASLMEWLKVPLDNIGIDIMKYGEDLFLPTILTAVGLSLVLEYSTTKTLSGTIQAFKDRVGGIDLISRFLAISLLILLQLVTFVGGAKNTMQYALIPSTYPSIVKQQNREVKYYDELVEAVQIKIKKVNLGDRSIIDDTYGSGSTNLATHLKSKLEKAKENHKVFIESEKEKAINYIDNKVNGTLKRSTKLIFGERFIKHIKPIEDSYNTAKTSKLNKTKSFLLSAVAHLAELEAKRATANDKMTKAELSFNEAKQRAKEFIPMNYYWYVAILLVIALSAMDFMQQRGINKATEIYDNAQNSNLNKGVELSKEESNLDILEDDEVDIISKESNIILNYMIGYFKENKTLPNRDTICDELGVRAEKISKFYSVQPHLFKRENGKKAVPTSSFLELVGIDV